MSEVLKRALEAKERAREEYKVRKRGGVGVGGRGLGIVGGGAGGRLAKGDRTLSAHEKHRRRLKKNQDSSAAARHARVVYNEHLEDVIQAAEIEQSMLSLEAARLRASRDALATQVYDLQTQLAALMPDEGPEYAREYEDACCTRKLLDALKHLPQFNMTPQAFAKSVMGVPTCPAL